MAEPYDDDFEEDGCTMDFFDETPDVSSAGAIATTSASGPVVYRHYEGEDFSQYLNDEDEDHQHNHWGGEPVPSGLPTDDRTYSRRRISTANIREKLGRLLLLPGTSGGRSRTSSTLAAAPQQTLNRITDISFADCKMGSVDRGASDGSVLGSDSGIDCRSGFSLETESDLGVQASSSWWDMDSLSSKRQPRSSASAIDLPRSVAGYSSNSSGRREQRRLDRPEAARSSGSSGGYESGGATGNREPARKQSDHPERTDGGTSKRLTNSFRKIYNTLSRRKPANSQQQNMSHDPDYEDIRL